MAADGVRLHIVRLALSCRVALCLRVQSEAREPLPLRGSTAEVTADLPMSLSTTLHPDHRGQCHTTPPRLDREPLTSPSSSTAQHSTVAASHFDIASTCRVPFTVVTMSQKGVPAVPPIPTPHILTGVKKVVFAYDLICPYAYIASRLLDEIAHECNAQVDFHPVLLSGLVTLDAASRDAEQPKPEPSAAKSAYMRLSLIREAARHGVELHFPAHHPVRSVAAMRVLAALEGAQRVALTHSMFRAYWVEGKDISNESVIMQCITTVRHQGGSN